MVPVQPVRQHTGTPASHVVDFHDDVVAQLVEARLHLLQQSLDESRHFCARLGLRLGCTVGHGATFISRRAVLSGQRI